MPKDTFSPEPSQDPSTRMSDVALRKKKNADAQAAFRARRANYIATLEETVTSLESVVLQLQDSCRESRSESVELRQENVRLRLELRERENFWRTLYQAKKTGRSPDGDDVPPQQLSSPFIGQTQSTPLLQHPYENGVGYRGETAASCHGSYNTPLTNPNFSNQPSAMPFTNNEVSIDGSALNHRGGKYAPFNSMHGSSRDVRSWQVSMASSVHTTASNTPQSQSPVYMDSPSITSTDGIPNYAARFSGDQTKSSLSSVLDNAPYAFPNSDRFHQNIGDSVPNSRSMSPTTSSTPSSSASMPLTSSFQFTFHEPPPGQDRSDFDYRRHSLPHCPEVTLHGGTADISLTGQSADAVRYRLATRRPDSSADHQPLLAPPENNPHHDQAGSDGESSFNPRQRTRRNTIASHSRSPSPGPAPISCTVAVIKAQAFGALRRTRARTKKTSEGAARVAMDVLEARGIGIGGSTSAKRPRLDDEDLGDAETP